MYVDAGFGVSLRGLVGRRVRLLAVVVAVVGAGVVGVGVGAGVPVARAVSGAAGGVSGSSSVSPVRGVTGSAYASTVVGAGGVHETVVSAAPRLFSDGRGGWERIVSSLRRVPGGWVNTANGWRVRLPSRLSAPVSIATPGGTVGFRLVGGRGVGSAAGVSAVYPNALAATTVGYAVSAEAVKETLMLGSRRAPSVVRWVLSLPAGASAVASGGGVVVRSKAGGVVATLVAPTVTDASGVAGRVAMAVAGAGRAPVVSVVVDGGWLSAPGRRFPVVVDPTVTVGAQNSCQLDQGSPSMSSCLGGLRVGASGGLVARAVLDVSGLASALPLDARIETASLRLGVASVTGSPGPISVYPLTRRFKAASWDNADMSVPWTAPGGDFTATAAGTVAAPSGGGGTVTVPLSTSLVQGWTAGQSADDGLIVRSATETGTNLVGFDPTGESGAFALTVTWHVAAPGGAAPTYTYRVDDRLTVGVNEASGTLGVQAVDLVVAGTGIPATVTRSYTSSSPAGDVGAGWTLNAGADVALRVNPDDVVAELPGTTGETFADNGGGYVTPPGVDAVLARLSATTWTLTFDASQQVDTFATTTACATSDALLRSVRDRNGDTVSYTYSPSACSPGGQPLLASVTDTRGRTITLSDSGGYLTGATDPAGLAVVWTPGGTGGVQLASSRDAAGKTTSFGYTSAGMSGVLDKIVDPDGHKVTVAYNTAGQVSSVTQVTDPMAMTGPTTTFSYTPGTLAAPDSGSTKVQDPLGHVTTYFYDHTDRTTKIVDANGNTRQAGYNPDDQPTSLTDGLTQTTTLAYDTNNVVTEATAPANSASSTGETTYLSYPTSSASTGGVYLPSSTLDADGNCTSFGYDSTGNPTSTVSGLAPTAGTTNCDGVTSGAGSATVTRGYQGDAGVASCGGRPGELCAVTSPAGGVTRYAYDTLGQVTSVTGPGGSCAAGSRTLCTSYTYDADSRVATVTDGKGQTAAYSYDGDSRTLRVLYDGATTCAYSTGDCITWVPDGDGNITSRVDATGTTGYGYDLLSRLTTEQLPGNVNACPGQASIGYSYDAASNLSGYCDAQSSVTYSYDPANRLTGLATGTGSCTGTITQPCTLYGYDHDNRLTTLTYPATTGVKETFGYNNAGRTVSAAVTGGASTAGTTTYTYEQGANDRPSIQSVHSTATGVTTTYSYTTRHQLAAAATGIPATTDSYTYDLDGNLATHTLGAATHTMAYTPADQLCWTSAGTTTNPCAAPPAGAVTYTYDPNGKQTASSAGLALAYNPLNQTTAMTGPTGTTPTPMGYTGPGNTQRSAAGATSFTLNTFGAATSTTAGATISFTRDPAGTLASLDSGPSRYYYLYDGTGSVTGLVNNAGTQVAAYTYDPYGTTTSSGPQAGLNPYRYHAGYQDPTGYYKYGARYYNPTLAAWTQPDPSGHDPGYTYAASDPINFADPTGESLLGDIGKFATGVIMTVSQFLQPLGAPGGSTYEEPGQPQSPIQQIEQTFDPQSYFGDEGPQFPLPPIEEP